MPKKKTSVKTSVKSRKTSKKKKKKRRTRTILLLAIGCIAVAIGAIYFIDFGGDDSDKKTDEKTAGSPEVCRRVEKNYGHTIDTCASLMKLNPKYLKALACLECSGRTDMPKRFEKHVYKRLKKVKAGELNEYEGVTKKMIADASDEALKNLATSWGPFQIMGYKCLHLNIKVSDLRGKDAVYWGVKWINMEYGNMVRKGNYRDAFHYHNTGRVYPKNGKPTTYDKNYVPKGLNYMRYF